VRQPLPHVTGSTRNAHSHRGAKQERGTKTHARQDPSDRRGQRQREAARDERGGRRMHSINELKAAPNVQTRLNERKRGHEDGACQSK
jgi:hypothetical protein